MLSPGSIKNYPNRIEQLQEIVSEELDICQQLLDYTRNKKELLKIGDINSLLKINKQEDILVLRLKALREAREYCCEENCEEHHDEQFSDSQSCTEEEIVRFTKTLDKLQHVAGKLKKIILYDGRCGNNRSGFLSYSPGILETLTHITKL